MAVRLRPQQEGGSGSSSSSGGSDSSGGAPNNGVGCSEEGVGVLPAFRLERQGLAIDEYHTLGDAAYEEELAKRVEAALSLSRPEDTSEVPSGIFSSCEQVPS